MCRRTTPRTPKGKQGTICGQNNTENTKGTNEDKSVKKQLTENRRYLGGIICGQNKAGNTEGTKEGQSVNKTMHGTMKGQTSDTHNLWTK